MKNYIFFCNLMFLGIHSFSQNTGLKFCPITIDSNLSNQFFNFSMHAHQTTGGTTIISNEETGKSDTFYSPIKETELEVNCKILDLGRHHLGFDNCISYFKKDTLLIQFQSNYSNTSEVYYWDKMILHLIKDQFYAEYIWSSKTITKLEVQGQMLKLRSLSYRKGERLMGVLTIQCDNKDPNSTYKLFTFSGPFNVVVE